MAEVTRVCARCGAAAGCPQGGVPAGWSVEAGERGVWYLCVSCLRANIRAIEAKLPVEYWDGS